MNNKPLHQFFTKDHHRIDTLLAKATQNPEAIDSETYKAFRIGLLTHIKMEENILFPAAKEANNGEPLPNFNQFRLEHGALTTLMAVPPNTDMLKVLRHILEKHDEAEEVPGGMYDVCENLTANRTQELIEQLKATKPVPVHPPNPLPAVLKAAKRIVKRAGYDYEAIAKKK